MTAASILSLGEPLVELNAARPGALSAVDTFTLGYGGDTSNFAVAVARLGGRAGYVSRVGADEFGTSLRDFWAREEVDTSHVTIDLERPTGIYFISHGPAGHTFTYYRAGSAASALTPADLPTAAITAARLLHVTGITQAISTGACDAAFAAIEAARAAGTPVSYDPNLRLGLWSRPRARATALASIALADVALPNLDEGRLLTGHSDPGDVLRALRGHTDGIVVLKLGADGALVGTAEGTVHVPGHPATVVDAAGAGDTFDAAFAVRWTEGADPVEAARFAVVAAAATVQGVGATAPIPRRAEVDRLLAAGRTGRPGGADTASPTATARRSR